MFAEEVFDNSFSQRRYTKEKKLQAVENVVAVLDGEKSGYRSENLKCLE